jgi:hypothetical protein
MFAVAEKPIGVREIKAVDALWKLSSLRGVIASDLRPSLADLPRHISAACDGAAQAR